MAQQERVLKLDECYALARANYPLVHQRDLLEKSKEYSVSNLSKGMLPQFSVSGQATYQSAVTSIPIKLPGLGDQTIPKDQYKLYAELSQPITDLITVSQQKKLQETNSTIQEQNLEVELYKLKDRVNQLFFGILLLEEQNKQNDLLKNDINNGIKKIKAAIANGAEYTSSLNKLKAELLKADQRTIELGSARKTYIDMLGLLLNQPLNETVQFEKPDNPAIAKTVNRPELQVFENQKTGYLIQDKLIRTRNLPKLNLFFQGGMGQPSPVNLFSNSLSAYYLTGLRLNWNLSGFYTYGKEKKLNELNRQIVDSQKETFLLNTNFSMQQQNGEIQKLNSLLQTDEEIVALRTSVKNTATIQLENGVISTNDYLKEINAEDQARQNRAIHSIQLLQAQYNYQNISGN